MSSVKWNSSEKCGCNRYNFTVTAICSVQSQVPDLQLFDGLSSFADDQANFVGRDEDLLDGAVAVHVAVEAWAVPTLLNNLIQQPLGLSAGAEWRPRNTLVTTVTDSREKRFSLSDVKEVFRWFSDWLRGDVKRDWSSCPVSEQWGTLSKCSVQFHCLSKLRGDTYSMFSGLPVSVQGLSNMPPLSVTKQPQPLKILHIFTYMS